MIPYNTIAEKQQYARTKTCEASSKCEKAQICTISKYDAVWSSYGNRYFAVQQLVITFTAIQFQS